MSSKVDRKYYETLESGQKFDAAELLMKEAHNDSALIDIDKIRLYKIERMCSELRKQYDTILKEKELDTLKFYIMGAIYCKKNVSPREIAQQCRVHRSTIYRASKQLVERGFMEIPCDNCGFHSRLTELGINEFKDIYEKIKRL